MNAVKELLQSMSKRDIARYLADNDQLWKSLESQFEQFALLSMDIASVKDLCSGEYYETVQMMAAMICGAYLDKEVEKAKEINNGN